MYPNINLEKKNYPLQSILFGHRIKPSQSKYEYLIEFLQVAIAEKRGGDNVLSDPTFISNEMFPVDLLSDGIFKYLPKSRIALKRVVFMPKSKLEGKANIDKEAYQACIAQMKEKIICNNKNKIDNSIIIIQNLLSGFCAVNQNRSWFDQNILPICPEVILPEGMGVKRWRQNLEFDLKEKYLDERFDYHRYTYMCRGGEIYYLHVLNAIAEYPKYKNIIEKELYNMISNFPQFSHLCNFIQNTWDENYKISQVIAPVVKELGAIPESFSKRNLYTLSELENFLTSKAHPFEKMETLANGIILQMLRMMYLAASTEKESNCWVIDVNCAGYDNNEAKKNAVVAFNHNEEVITKYLYKGLEIYRDKLSDKKTDQELIKDAADDSYRLFRKLGKTIGIIIPKTGRSMRFTLSEEIIKFLVLAIIPPMHMITLDEFVDLLYEHYGMVISPKHYRIEERKGSVAEIGDCSFLEMNLDAFSQKLKDCGFLRDLSDATAIVENPYEREDD